MWKMGRSMRGMLKHSDDASFNHHLRPSRARGGHELKEHNMAVNIKRLLKLASFLQKLPDSHFNFGVVRNRCKKSKENTCGTVGCAIGWTPSVFPELVRLGRAELSWRRGGSRLPVMRIGEFKNDPYYESVARGLFGMSKSHAFNLFTPYRQSPADQDYCLEGATPKQVAKRIRTYAKWAKAKGL
jgi:hypothetical protein